jgi:hypothetical protein
MDQSNNNTFETVLKWIVMVILAIVALKVVVMILGTAFFIGGFLLYRVLPLVLMVWLALKVFEWLRGKNCGGSSSPSTLSDADL